MVGATAATAAAALGGHLVYRTGTGVDVNAFDTGPERLDRRRRRRRRCPAARVGYVRSGRGQGAGRCTTAPAAGTASAPAAATATARCRRATFEDGCVMCPWHESRFRLDDGSVVDGPATAPQPRYDVRGARRRPVGQARAVEARRRP